jgi:hypothetical protein
MGLMFDCYNKGINQDRIGLWGEYPNWIIPLFVPILILFTRFPYMALLSIVIFRNDFIQS